MPGGFVVHRMVRHAAQSVMQACFDSCLMVVNTACSQHVQPAKVSCVQAHYFHCIAVSFLALAVGYGMSPLTCFEVLTGGSKCGR